MKTNKDGSLKLGTLQTTALLALASAHNASILKDITDFTADRDAIVESDIESKNAVDEIIAQLRTKLINVDALTSAKALVDAEVERFVTVIKRELDKKLSVLIVPNEPASEENVEVPFLFDAYVSYMKRKNPTRSATAKQQLADALALKLANERNAKKEALKEQLLLADFGSIEYNRVLDEIIRM